MPEPNWITRVNKGRIPEQGQYLFLWHLRIFWQRIAIDSVFTIIGVTLVTGVIAITHLYPRLPSSLLIYLLMIVALASVRGHYAAILGALLSSFFFDIVLAPSSDMFTATELGDLLNPLVFLATAIITGQWTAALRRRVEQARRREYETRLLAQQTQELAALQERQRLARELHDSVSQVLYSISLGAYTIREALDKNPREATAPVDYVINLTEAGMAEMRALIFELRPESLSTEGLVGALTKQVAVLRTRYKLTVKAQFDEEPPMSLSSKHALYRITQESLHNIVKHADASTVSLVLVTQNSKILLEVHDDGKGFDTTGSFPGHLGLLSIQERTAQLGGTCSIESSSTQGTHLRVCIPIQAKSSSTTNGVERHRENGSSFLL